MVEETGDPLLQDVVVSTGTGNNTKDSQEDNCCKQPSTSVAQLKSKLQQVVTAAQHDLEATEEELDMLRQENVETRNRKQIPSSVALGAS